MKRILLLTLIGLLVLSGSGCSLNDLGKIKIINDEIDNSRVVLLRVVYKSSDTGMSNYRALITYSRKMKENEATITAVNFKINTALMEIILAPKCYLVTDGQKFELVLSNISSKTDSYTESDTNLDGQVVVHTYKYYLMEGDLSLSSENTDQIKNSTKLIYRLYLGTRPLTFEIAGKDLDLVKVFIDSK